MQMIIEIIECRYNHVYFLLVSHNFLGCQILKISGQGPLHSLGGFPRHSQSQTRWEVLRRVKTYSIGILHFLPNTKRQSYKMAEITQKGTFAVKVRFYASLLVVLAGIHQSHRSLTASSHQKKRKNEFLGAFRRNL
jgi:hypothetical protein